MPEAPKERNTATLEELTISNMYEIEAVIELLEEKGITTKEEVLGRKKKMRGEG